MSKRVITLGTWNGNPIEWIVLKEDDFSALVVSKNVLFTSRFNSNYNDWNNSEIRAYLNGDFFRQAFTDEDRKFVVNAFVDGRKTDVFLLSKGEAESYMSGAELTASSWWWLRSPYPDNRNISWGVSSDGSFAHCCGLVSNALGVRPAMYVKE